MLDVGTTLGSLCLGVRAPQWRGRYRSTSENTRPLKDGIAHININANIRDVQKSIYDLDESFGQFDVVVGGIVFSISPTSSPIRSDHRSREGLWGSLHTCIFPLRVPQIAERLSALRDGRQVPHRNSRPTLLG